MRIKNTINNMHINLSLVIILIKKGSKEAANVILMVQYGDLSLCFSHVDIFCKTCRWKFVNKNKNFKNRLVYGTMNSNGDPLCFDYRSSGRWHGHLTWHFPQFSALQLCWDPPDGAGLHPQYSRGTPQFYPLIQCTLHSQHTPAHQSDQRGTEQSRTHQQR